MATNNTMELNKPKDESVCAVSNALIILQNRNMKGELIFHSTSKYILFLCFYS